jgi:hypothetical protein
MTSPATTLPTIYPPLVIELSSPRPCDRSPGSCEPSDQVAGQNIARDTITQSCAAKSAAKVDAEREHRAGEGEHRRREHRQPLAAEPVGPHPAEQVEADLHQHRQRHQAADRDAREAEVIRVERDQDVRHPEREVPRER